MASKRAGVGMGFAAIAAVLLVSTACSSSPTASSVSSSSGSAAVPSSSGSAAAATTPLGSPVKIGLIGSLKTPSLDVSASVSSAEAAARAINAAGGLQGHQVVIDSCNDQFSAAGAETCGRQMISDHVIAVTGSSIFDTAFQPLLASAGIPIVGFAATSIDAYTGANEYLLAPGSLFEIYGAVYYAAKHGSRSIYVSRSDVAVTAAVSATIKAAAAKVGYDYIGQQAIPASATDLSSYAEQFKSSGSNAVALAVADSLAVNYATTGSSLGLTTQKYIYTVANLSAADIKQLGPTGSNFIIGASLPPLTATSIPGVKLFLSQLAAEAATGDAGAAISQQSETSLLSWLAVTAISKVLAPQGAPTATTLTQALKTAKNVNLDGVIPPWTPDKPGAAPFTRISNPYIFIEKIVNGNLQLVPGPQINSLTSMGM